jgi:hypothetical protein
MQQALWRVRTRRTLIILSAAAAVAVALVAPAAPAFASNQTVTVNFASTTGTANGVGSGFLYGLSQDGTGPDDGLLASLAPTSGRGGGARLAGGGWIGDGYTDGTGFTTRIDSAIDQARPRRYASSRRRRSPRGSAIAWICLPRGTEGHCRATRRSRRLSTGAMSLRRHRSESSSGGWPSSPGASRWKRPRTYAGTGTCWSCSPSWWTSPQSFPLAAVPPVSGCSRRFTATPESGCGNPVSREFANSEAVITGNRRKENLDEAISGLQLQNLRGALRAHSSWGRRRWKSQVRTRLQGRCRIVLAKPGRCRGLLTETR